MVFDETLDTLSGHASGDSLGAVVAHGTGDGEGNLFAGLLHHVQDSNELEIPFGHVTLPQFDPVMIAGIPFDFSITKHVVFLWISALILIVAAGVAAWKNRKRQIPTGFGNLMEVFVTFIRDEVAVPNMGPAGMKYVPFLLTTFFFILTMNLIGLIPFGATPTGNVSVTAGLAIIAFVMIQAAAIREQGLGHYLMHLTGGVHWLLWPIMVPIEILGLFTKPFALCIRLFANMTGGHTVIVALLGLIFIFKSYLVAVGPFGFVLGIMVLELFVAFLQAYVFTMLTSLFMGLGMNVAEEQNDHDKRKH